MWSGVMVFDWPATLAERMTDALIREAAGDVVDEVVYRADGLPGQLAASKGASGARTRVSASK